LKRAMRPTAESSAREALATFRATKMPELEIQARAILAQALLAQEKVNLAQKEIAQGRALAAKTQQRLIRLRFEIAAAQVQAASGKPSDLQAARNTLEAVIHETERMQALSDLFEARFAQGRSGIEVRQPGDRWNAGCWGPEGCRRLRVRVDRAKSC
jgi:hypothetical protein